MLACLYVLEEEMSVPGSPPEVKKDVAKAVSGAGRKALLVFLILSVVFAAALTLILYLATHWPYPPGFEWVSRWTPRQLFTTGLVAIAVYLVLSALFVWRLSTRWIWGPAASVLNILEGAHDKGGLGPAGPPGDRSQFLYRVERAVERGRSASDEARGMDDVKISVGRLCEDIEQMGVRHFDGDFPAGVEVLEPLGKSLKECCAELAGFLGGCSEVAAQISGTLGTAREKAAALSSQAERAFVRQSELSVGAKDFVKRVEEALSIAALESRGEAGGEARRSDDDAFNAFGQSLDNCTGVLDRFSVHDGVGHEVLKDSKSLADEATVIALNAAIEASRTGSSDLESLADNARKLAERSMELGEKVDSMSNGYLDAVNDASAALEELRLRLSAWYDESRADDSKRSDSASGLEQLLSSVGDMAASLASHVENVAELSETASSEGQAARKAIDEALSEMESLRRRLGGQSP
jgi:methyl-accepting chemotaxis protein